jgi:hypothetical protein
MSTADLSAHTGPILVTLAYVGVYYAFMVNVLRVKTRLYAAYKARGEKFDRYFDQDREMLAADRIQLNTLEHMGPFLVLLWLNAVFVGPYWATVAGAVYVASRAIYPLLMGGSLGRGIASRVYVATFLGYAVLTYYAGALVFALVTG